MQTLLYMKRKVLVLLREFVLAALVPALVFSLSACEPDDGTGSGGDGIEDTTSKIAVTGLVDKLGCTYADISGYANLNLLPAGSGNPVIGVEVVEAKAGNNEKAVRSTTCSLIGNIFTVSFRNLSPATEYKYRSFVIYGGKTYYGCEYNTFTTKEVVDLTSAGEASGITLTSAILSAAVRTVGVDARDDFYVGLAWAASESAICAGGEYESSKVSVRQVNKGEFTVSLSYLPVNTTYYYASFTMVGDVCVFSSVKSFTTRELANLVGEVEVSDIGVKSARLSAPIQTDSVDAKDKVNVGFAWSTFASDFCSDGDFKSTKTSVRNVRNGMLPASLRGLSVGTTYYYVSFTEVGGVYVFSSVKSFTTEAAPEDAVDLGLSVLWASCNVGAESPEEYGGYFAWGETETKSDYSPGASVTYGVDVSELESQGFIGTNGRLTPVYDAATVIWGGDWRMPTLEESIELLDKCTWEWTSVNGVNGQKITGPNGNSIFLPAAGYRRDEVVKNSGSYGCYWSATCYGYYSYNAYSFYFDASLRDWYYYYRFHGRTIRPVIE